jgi:ActD protein
MESALGLFDYVDELANAAERMKSAGYHITVFSPVPLGHELEPVLGKQNNPIKYFTFLGGVSGFCFGMVLCLGTIAMYPLARGGRMLWAFPPPLIISYETTILLGVLSTLAAFVLFAGLPSAKEHLTPEISVDSFGLLVQGIRRGSFNEIEKILIEHGAKEVKQVEE